jgi:hypothetical protein
VIRIVVIAWTSCTTTCSGRKRVHHTRDERCIVITVTIPATFHHHHLMAVIVLDGVSTLVMLQYDKIIALHAETLEKYEKITAFHAETVGEKI